MIKAQISGRMASIGISDVVTDSVYLEEKKSEEVDDDDKNDNWASEASPTLGCSIEISRDTSKEKKCKKLKM